MIRHVLSRSWYLLAVLAVVTVLYVMHGEREPILGLLAAGLAMGTGCVMGDAARQWRSRYATRRMIRQAQRLEARTRDQAWRNN